MFIITPVKDRSCSVNKAVIIDEERRRVRVKDGDKLIYDH